MICPHCHTENRPGAKFCNECGCKLDVAPAQEREAEEAVGASADEVVEAADPTEVMEPIELKEPAEPVETAEDAAADDADGAADEDADKTADDAEAEEDADEEADDEDAAADGAEADADSADDDPSEPLARTGMMPRINIVADRTQIMTPVAAADEGAEEAADAAAAPEEADASDSASDDTVAAGPSAFAETYARAVAADRAPARPQADLSGFDEYLVNPGYVPAPSAWRAGDTMQMPALKDVEGPKQKEFKAPTDPEKRSRKSAKGKGGKIAAAVIAVLVVAAAIAAGVTYQMEMWGGKIVPSVVGMTQADATFVLENKGFTVRTTSVASDDTEGMVLLMDPGANARQEEGSEVVIHVSTSRLVPDVVGKSQEEAERLFDDNGFENVTYVQENSDENAGSVLAVSPEAGEKAKAKSAITVTVAKPYTVPDVTGMTPSQAAAAIEEAGLTSSTVTVYSETIPEGYMIGIDPASGTEVSSSTVVTISVAKSRGTELVAAARSYLASGSLKASDGSTFTVSSVNSCTYQGNDEVAFAATGVASTSVTVLGQTISVSGDSKQVSGTIGFDAYNNVTSISFS